MVSRSVEKLKGTAADTAHTAIDAAKGVLSFLEHENKPEDQAEQCQDVEKKNQSVSEKVALGEVAVKQTVKRPRRQSPKSAKGSTRKKRQLNGLAAEDRYSMLKAKTLEGQALMAQARAEREREIAAQASAELERYRLWSEKRAHEVLSLEAALEKKKDTNKDDLEIWIEQHSPAEVVDEAYRRAIGDKKESNFNAAKVDVVNGSRRARQALLMAEEIRKARAKFERLLDEGELDEESYIELLSQREEQVSQREDALQDMLIKYSPAATKDPKNLISQGQQDFIIDYSGGAYNEIIEVKTPEGSVAAANGAGGKTATIDTSWVDSKNGSSAESATTATEANVDEASRLQGEVLGEDPNQGVPFERALVPVGVVRDHDISEEDASKHAPASAGAAAGSNGHIDSEPATSIDIEELKKSWSGSGEIEAIAMEIMQADPDLFARYVKARDKFVTDEANALGAGISSSEQSTGWKERLSRLTARFKKQSQEGQEEQEGFDIVYGEALKMALGGTGGMTPEEVLEHKQELEANAAYWLKWDISNTKMEAQAGGEEKSSLSRRATIISGLGIAAVAGAVTGAAERLRNGDNHGLLLVTAAGAGAIFGGVAGYKVAKSNQPKEDEDTINASAQAASDAVNRKYDSDSTKPDNEELVGLESVRYMTKQEKKKRMIRNLGAIGIGAGAGAATGAGVHWLVDVFPTVSSLRGGDTSTLEGQPEPTTDQAQAVTTEAVDVIDSDGDGVGDNADAFPYDSNETVNSDQDGVGDNADAFPTDSNEWVDSDKDGVGNNADAFPYDSSETLNSDRDGVGDNADVFPDDPNEWADTDKDGVGDNADAFPNDPSETKNSDSDGVGDNADAFPTDSNEWVDSDGDGVGDNADVPIAEDTTETEPNPPRDQSIYVDPGSGITPEIDEYVNDTYGVDLNSEQLRDMYNDLFGLNVDTPGEYTPGEVFGDVEFYEMPDGQWGMKDVGHATITPVGQEAIHEWLVENTELLGRLGRMVR